jgi:hypothetical protein
MLSQPLLFELPPSFLNLGFKLVYVILLQNKLLIQEVDASGDCAFLVGSGADDVD